MKEKMIEYLAKQIGLKNAVILTNGILSLPVEGCGEVKVNCDFMGNPSSKEITDIHGTISCPLTLGELPDRYRKMREFIQEIASVNEKQMSGEMGLLTHADVWNWIAKAERILKEV